MSAIFLFICKIPLLLLDGLFMYYSPARLLWRLCKGKWRQEEEESLWQTALLMFFGLLSWVFVILMTARLIYFINH